MIRPARLAVLLLAFLFTLGFVGLLAVGQDAMCQLHDGALRYCQAYVPAAR